MIDLAVMYRIQSMRMYSVLVYYTVLCTDKTDLSATLSANRFARIFFRNLPVLVLRRQMLQMGPVLCTAVESKDRRTIAHQGLRPL